MFIREVALEQRPRERAQLHGVDVLSDAEVLALLLAKGSKSQSVFSLAHDILAKFSLGQLAECSLHELMNIKGIGLAKACQLHAAFELSKRLVPRPKQAITSADDVVMYLQNKFSSLKREHFIALHLDTKNTILAEEVISIGTLNASLIHPREVFKNAIKNSAQSIIVIHNHPSGDTSPSEEDIRVTKLLKQASELLHIQLLDHIIIGSDSFYSFAREGML